MKKFFIELITNFQPRMNLGRKRFSEESALKSRHVEEKKKADYKNLLEKRDEKWIEPPLPTQPQKKEE